MEPRTAFLAGYWEGRRDAGRPSLLGTQHQDPEPSFVGMIGNSVLGQVASSIATFALGSAVSTISNLLSAD